MVTKPGNYVITGTANPNNGYGFYLSGTFLNNGVYTLQVPSQGTPINSQTDNIKITINGQDIDCPNNITIPVDNTPTNYTISCGSLAINGNYTANTPLTAANNITILVNVTTIGSYSISTNQIDGFSFSCNGSFSTTGNHTVTLYGNGMPTSSSTKNFTITSDSQAGAATCSAMVNVNPVKKEFTILHIGTEASYGYSAFSNAPRKLLDSPSNFGPTGVIVQNEIFKHISIGASPSDAVLKSSLDNKPDIVIIGHIYNPTTSQSQYLAQYLNNKGVLVAFQEYSTGPQNLLRAVFNTNTISVGNAGPAGSVYLLPNSNDPILNGPFGDVRNKNWGEDASYTKKADGLPISDISIYSEAKPINMTTNISGITAFKHNIKSFVWFGDGGFISSNLTGNGLEYISNTIIPFVAPQSGNFFPLQKENYGYAGNGNAAGSMKVQNAIIFANVMAWAVEKAKTAGINIP